MKMWKFRQKQKLKKTKRSLKEKADKMKLSPCLPRVYQNLNEALLWVLAVGELEVPFPSFFDCCSCVRSTFAKPTFVLFSLHSDVQDELALLASSCLDTRSWRLCTRMWWFPQFSLAWKENDSQTVQQTEQEMLCLKTVMWSTHCSTITARWHLQAQINSKRCHPVNAGNKMERPCSWPIRNGEPSVQYATISI